MTHLDQKQRLGIGHVRLGDMNPFGVFAKLINRGTRGENVVPYQGAGEVLDAMPTKDQLEKFGNLPSEKELVEKGFDPSTFYHGSPEKNIMKFAPQNKNSATFGGFTSDGKLKYAENAPVTFFTESPTYTKVFAKRGGMPIDRGGIMDYMPLESSRIYPVKLKMDKVYDYNNPEHRVMLSDEIGESLENDVLTGNAFEFQTPKISGAIKKLGFRGYLTNETARFGERTVGLFYPEKGDVRSVFAQFDPKKAEDGNIYASLIPPLTTAVGVGALAGLEDAT